jgi:DNA-binding response OmpR family regulator
MRIILLSDGWKQVLALRRHLMAAGHSTDFCNTLAELAETLESDNFDALAAVYDSPDNRALSVVAQIRWKLNFKIPLILITPHQTEDYVVRALREGADDYMPVPIRLNEFLARLEALTRRSWYSSSEHHSVQVGRMRINLATRRIYLNDVPIELTSKDFDLAALFLRNVGRLITRTRIMQVVWGAGRSTRSRTLDTHISRVRRKLLLNEANGWKLTAVYRHGYRLESLPERPIEPFTDRARTKKNR